MLGNGEKKMTQTLTDYTLVSIVSVESHTLSALWFAETFPVLDMWHVPQTVVSLYACVCVFAPNADWFITEQSKCILGKGTCCNRPPVSPSTHPPLTEITGGNVGRVISVCQWSYLSKPDDWSGRALPVWSPSVRGGVFFFFFFFSFPSQFKGTRWYVGQYRHRGTEHSVSRTAARKLLETISLCLWQQLLQISPWVAPRGDTLFWRMRWAAVGVLWGDLRMEVTPDVVYHRSSR